MTPNTPRAHYALALASYALIAGGVLYQWFSPRWSFEAIMAIVQGIALSVMTLDSVALSRERP
jgi:fatty acid desaturase